MQNSNFKKLFVAGLCMIVSGLLAAGGCGKKDEGPKHKSIEGKVTRIDTASDEVAMMWYNDKDKTEKEVTGALAPEAEIFINGRTAKLEDVKVDDQVKVTGRIEKHDGEVKLVAVKVYVTRPTAAEATETAPASSQPK